MYMSTYKLEKHLATRLKNMTCSAIRDMLKQAGRPGFISLGGGYPDPESFPIDIIRSLRILVKRKYKNSIYQYGRSEGLIQLFEQLIPFFKRTNRSIKATPHTISITTGSQQALAILAMMFIDPGDYIAVETPTYLGALQAFNPFQPRYIELEVDDEGIVPDKLDKTISKYPNIKFIYIIPTFQNPTGKTLSLDRRVRIAKILRKHDVIAVEDDPYSELRYEAEPIPSLQSLIPEKVIHLFTFSKTFAPDFRIGGIVAPPEVCETATMIKQGLDLYTSNYNQAMVTEYLAGGHLEPHLKKIINLYKPRRDLMMSLIDTYFPLEISHTNPLGGMFVWAYSNNSKTIHINTILDEALKKNVGFVPGNPFFARKKNSPFSTRLNFTNQSNSNIEKGIKILGQILHKYL